MTKREAKAELIDFKSTAVGGRGVSAGVKIPH